MAVIGCLGDIVFTVSDQEVRTLENWKWSGSSRYFIHQRNGTHALTEYTGMDPDKITFNMTLLREMGVDPLDDIVKLWKYVRTGEAVPLTIGTHCYGKYRWNVVSIDTEVKYTDRRGDIADATVGVTLQEYLRT